MRLPLLNVEVSNILIIESLIIILFIALLSYSSIKYSSPSFKDEVVDIFEGKKGEGKKFWFGIYLDDNKVGYGVHQEVQKEDGILLSEALLFRMKIGGVERGIITLSSANLTREYILKSFSFMSKTGDIKMLVQGVVEGDTIRTTITSGGKKDYLEFKTTKPPQIPLTLNSFIAKDGMEEGKTFRIPLFDPSTMKEEIVEVAVDREIEMMTGGEGGEKEKLFILKTNFHGITLKAWVTKEGEVIKEESGLGLVIKREEREVAMHMDEKMRGPDILATFSIPCNRKIEAPERVRFLKAKIKGVADDKRMIQDEIQSFEDGILNVRIPDISKTKGYRIPLLDPRFEEWMAPTPFIQKDSPEIVTKADRILDDEIDSKLAAQKLLNWVYENIKKEITTSIPFSVDILKNKRGDCNEHATLFAALSRACGIPTKVCLGIVYSKAGVIGPSFYYHAWNEVYLDRWVPVDATFGQFPADATHIKFAEGDVSDYPSMLPFIGNVEVEILDYYFWEQ